MTADHLNDRVLICGDSETGKTSLFERIKGQNFPEKSPPTKIASYFSYRFRGVDGEFDINIWDVGGDPRVRHLAEMYFENIEIAVVVFDLTKKESFQSAQKWIESVLDKSKNASIFLVANKSDLNSEINETELQSLNYRLFRVSAKSREGVDQLITALGEECVRIQNKKAEEMNKAFSQNVHQSQNDGNGDKQRNNVSCCNVA